MNRRGEHGGIFFRLLFLLGFLAFLAFLYIVRHPLMRLAGEAWMVSEPTGPADAIIVLGDDNYAGDRAFHAAELYRSGIAPVVVASGRMLRVNVSLADLIAHDLQSFGIPASAVVKFPHRASNTKQEAEADSGLIARSGWKRILIVTSNYDARRAGFIFDRVLPSGISLRVSGARDSEFNPSDWWETRTSQKLFLDQLVGYAAARWELRGNPAGGGAAVFAGHFPRFAPLFY
ncbi:MAG: YdcF family protein [Acidobacteriia bacterium]|nr:YdcF family protein [Terriglobia bacterium]